MKTAIAAILSLSAVLLALSFLPSSQNGKDKGKDTTQSSDRGSSHSGQRSENEPAAGKKQSFEKEDGSVKLRWETLSGLDMETGDISMDLKKVLKGSVKIPGFVVPLDLNAKETTEFLLVPTYGACLHTPPPPSNQMVLVKMGAGYAPKRDDGPVWLIGTLKSFKTDTNWGKAGFMIEDAKTIPYKGGY